MKAFALLRQTFTDPRLALMLALGYSSGLPFLLIFSTQSAWLAEAKVPPSQIGLMSYCALAFSFKFLWAPVIDRFDVRGLARGLGRRRAWMICAQLFVAAGLAGLAFANPAQSLAWSISFALLTAFAAATQDVTIDAWRIDAAPIEMQGLMTAVYSLGYRLGMFSAGAGALYIAFYYNWRAAYLVMAGLTGVGMIACLLSPRLDKPELARGDAATPAPAASPTPPGRARLIGAPQWVALKRFYQPPVYDLIQRNGWKIIAILLLVALYRLPDFVSGVMANPLYIHLGFTKFDIATVSKAYGIWIGIAGAFAGGWLTGTLGLMPTLLIGGVAASASHLSLSLLASYPGRLDLLTFAVSVESFASGFAGAALIAYMSSLVSPAFTATQYALLSSLYALPGKFVGGLSGFMVEAMGYPRFFAMTALIGVPVALLCLLVWRLNTLANGRALKENPA